MFCGKCGKEIKKDNLFCTSCGERAEEKTTEEIKRFNKKPKDITDYVDAALSLGDILEYVINESDQDLSGHSGRELIKTELLLFCYYICNFNSANYDKKGEIISKYLDYTIDGKLLLPALKAVDVVKDNFSTEIPYSIIFMAMIDKRVDTKGCKILIDAYNELGLSLLYCDIGSDERAEAVKGYENYITMLNKYVEEECGYLKGEQTKLLSYKITYELGKYERKENDIILCITKYNNSGELGIGILVVVYDDDDDEFKYFLQDYDMEGNILSEKNEVFTDLKLIKPTDGTYNVVEFSGTEIVISSEQYNELSDFLYNQ